MSKPPTLAQVFGSVLAAAFGVQSRKNRQRDFERGRLWQYIVIGVTTAAVFVLFLLLLTKFVVSAFS